MYRKPAHDEKKSGLSDILDQVIALKNAWHELDLKHKKFPDMDGKQSDDKGRMIVDYWRSLVNKIRDFVPSNDQELRARPIMFGRG